VLPLNPDDLEQVHARWEQLMHIIQAGKNMTRLQYYSRGGIKPAHSGDFKETICIEEKTICDTRGKKPSKGFATLWKAASPSIGLDQITLLGSSNPGFDIVYFDKVKGKGAHVPCVVECRLGTPRTGAEIKQKLQLTAKSLEPVYPAAEATLGTSIAKDSVVQVFVEANKDQVNLPRTCQYLFTIFFPPFLLLITFGQIFFCNSMSGHGALLY